ncbi:MAG: cupin domain-containing protein [Stellaceae bacterium]
MLCATAGGSMATFALAPGAVTRAVAHGTIDEIWYVCTGEGRVWRRSHDAEEVTDLVPGLSLTIPVGTAFQFRCDGAVPLRIVAATLPPWPGDGEAQAVSGKWIATL